MRAIWWVGLGSALGGTGRHGLVLLMYSWSSTFFPWGTLTANLFGSALIGGLAALTGPDGRWMLSLEKRLFLMAGFCGGFTTYSLFSLQTLQLLQEGSAMVAVLYSVITVMGSLAAAWVGFQLCRKS